MVTMSKEYRKEYYEKNKQKIIEQMKTEVQCEICHEKIRKCRINRHQKTKKCQDKLKDEKLDDIQQLKEQYKELKAVVDKINQNGL